MCISYIHVYIFTHTHTYTHTYIQTDRHTYHTHTNCTICACIYITNPKPLQGWHLVIHSAGLAACSASTMQGFIRVLISCKR